MKRSRWPDLILCLAVVAITATFAAQRSPVAREVAGRPVPSSPTNVQGIYPGMSRDEVVRRLGPPTSQGVLQVGDGTGSWMEYGSPICTWEGHPTITFHPGGRVLSVIGDNLYLGNTTVQLGGPLAIPNGETTCTQQVDSGSLMISTRGGRVSRILLSEHPQPKPSYR